MTRGVLAEVDTELLCTLFGVLTPIEACESLVPHNQPSAVIASETDFVGEHLDLSSAMGAYDSLWERLNHRVCSWTSGEHGSGLLYPVYRALGSERDIP